MFDEQELRDRLLDALEALERIPYRFEEIKTSDDFIADESGREHLDSICMVLIAVGEAFRQIDQKSQGAIRRKYPDIPWAEVIGTRNVIAHGYFDVDHEQVYAICQEDIPKLIQQLRKLVSGE